MSIFVYVPKAMAERIVKRANIRFRHDIVNLTQYFNNEHEICLPSGAKLVRRRGNRYQIYGYHHNGQDVFDALKLAL